MAVFFLFLGLSFNSTLALADPHCEKGRAVQQEIPVLGAIDAINKLAPAVCETTKKLFYELRQKEHAWANANPWVQPPISILALQKKYAENFRECEKVVQKTCRPARKAISAKKLEKLFLSWTANKLYRMPSPNIHCYHRAYLLAQEITNAGYDAELVKITSKGPLVGITRDRNGRPVGFIDYGGKGELHPGPHWVVMLKTREKNGNDYILDPQFAEHPMKKEDYFRMVTGVSCNLPEKSSFWCEYQAFAPNALSSADESRRLEAFIAPQACQFLSAGQIEKEIRSLNSVDQYGGGDPIPFQAPPDKLQNDLVKHQWKMIKEKFEKSGEQEHKQALKQFPKELE